MPKKKIEIEENATDIIAAPSISPSAFRTFGKFKFFHTESGVLLEANNKLDYILLRAHPVNTTQAEWVHLLTMLSEILAEFSDNYDSYFDIHMFASYEVNGEPRTGCYKTKVDTGLKPASYVTLIYNDIILKLKADAEKENDPL